MTAGADMTQRTGDCYIDVWREADFRGETLRIYGPAEYASLEFDQGNWGDRICSLRVGPNAFVLGYRRRDFQEEPVTFGPNDEVADLSQFKIDDDIESLKVIDSLKIFNRLDYNAALAAETTPAPDPGKGGRRRGRRH